MESEPRTQNSEPHKTGKRFALVLAVDSRQALGKRGEDLACAELERRGYDILDRRFRTRFGELDIVARDNGVLVFVEVRARSGCRFGSPFESVTSKKRRRICAMAETYLFVKHLAGAACRFDVVSVIEERGGRTVELMKGAFDLQR